MAPAPGLDHRASRPFSSRQDRPSRPRHPSSRSLSDFFPESHSGIRSGQRGREAGQGKVSPPRGVLCKRHAAKYLPAQGPHHVPGSGSRSCSLSFCLPLIPRVAGREVDSRTGRGQSRRPPRGREPDSLLNRAGERTENQPFQLDQAHGSGGAQGETNALLAAGRGY